VETPSESAIVESLIFCASVASLRRGAGCPA
jgi:hypothetical protein